MYRELLAVRRELRDYNTQCLLYCRFREIMRKQTDIKYLATLLTLFLLSPTTTLQSIYKHSHLIPENEKKNGLLRVTHTWWSCLTPNSFVCTISQKIWKFTLVTQELNKNREKQHQNCYKSVQNSLQMCSDIKEEWFSEPLFFHPWNGS